MKALLGKKIGMSQVFSPEGEVIPVTIIMAKPNAVTLRRLQDRDGYSAVQLALPKDKVKKDGERYTAKKEFKADFAEDVQELNVTQFAPGDIVEVAGISKGKGFQGVVKLHHFKGGPKSHGHRHVLRKAGSIGSRYPQHTRKGKRMAARMGGDRVTVKNLQVVTIDVANNLMAIKGAVPGKRGSVVAIRTMEVNA